MRPIKRLRSTATCIAVCLSLVLVTGVARADDEATPPAPTSPTPPKPAAPEWPSADAKPDHSEWVKLKSGEWLRGKITVLRKEELQFDSDELDDLKLKWEDVAELRSPRVNTFAFTDRRTALGVGQIIGDRVIILTALGEQTYPRDELLSIVSGGVSEWNHWSGELSVGFTLITGNTNQFNGLLTAGTERRTAFARFTVDYVGNYGTQSGSNTVNNQGLTSRFDLFIYKRFFVTPIVTDFYTDEFQNIRYRLSPGAGIGYELLEKRWIELTVGLDGMYRATKYNSVQPGFDLIDRDAALRFSTSWEIDITTIVELDGSYSVTMGIPDPTNTNQHFDSTLSVDITKIFNINVSFIWDRVGAPQPDSQGVVPLKDDLTLTLGLGIDF
jgi:hypothetical protein